ncbi:MAG: hypothetical protein V4622_02235 [Bacteroidota bacterium]
MKKIITLITLSLFLVNSNAQTLQTYNGVFENGKAVYQYYENEKSDRIYEGTFSYVSKLYSVIGQFKENKRTGKWKVSAVNKVFTNEKGKISLNTLISGSYLAGSMDGIWTFSNTTKTFNPKTKKANPKAEKVVAIASFKDNHFTGKFSYDKTFLTKTVISGQFNEGGFADGVWSVKSPKLIEEIKYKNGLIYSKLVKDITTGEKIIYYDSSLFQEQFWQAYNPATKMAQMNEQIYFLDTIEVQNEAISLWSSDQFIVEKFSTIINPLYYYKKGQTKPHAYEVKIIACADNTDCYAKYMRMKNEELDRVLQEQYALSEKLRLENLEKEELARIEKEKEMERIRLENISNTILSGDKLMEQKKYREAIEIYTEANTLQYSEDVSMKILSCQKEMHDITAKHEMKKELYDKMNTTSTAAFAQTSLLLTPLKNKKKTYANNYTLCMDYLKINFNTKLDAYKKLNPSFESNTDSWTDTDEKSTEMLKELNNVADEVAKFQAAVSDATMTNNKNKLRVLNSSINPKIIVNDMINFKQVK